MCNGANYMQNMLQTVCFTYLTPRQGGLGSWFRSSPLGVPGPFALASLQWDGLRLPVLDSGPDSARAQDAKWSLRAQ